MATKIHSDEPTYDSPAAFFNAMDYENDQVGAFDTMSEQYAPFKATSKLNPPLDPSLNHEFSNFNYNPEIWSTQPQFSGFGAINPMLSPVDGYDTGYVSHDTLSDKSPPGLTPQQYPVDVTQKTSETKSRSRKRSSAKSKLEPAAASQQSDTKQGPARKARRTSKTGSIVAKMAEVEEAPPEDEKREQFLARNREAASKCRAKKKEWTSGLEERARELAQEKQMLTTYLAMLKNELLMLKCKCLEHSDCKCDGIRDYLKNTVTKLPPANAALYNKLEGAAADDLSSEVSRKQSMIGLAMGPSPEAMVTSPSSDDNVAEIGDAEYLRLEQELTTASKD